MQQRKGEMVTFNSKIKNFPILTVNIYLRNHIIIDSSKERKQIFNKHTGIV